MRSDPPSKTAEAQAFETRLDEHRGIVYKIANSYCLDGAERDDLVQEICLQLWRSYPRFDSERRFSTWMYRVALNTAISYSRVRGVRESRAAPFDEATTSGLEAALPDERDERVELLYGFLRRLGELDRALMVLYLEDRSHREIAEILGVSETNVGTKLSRLKQKIRREMASDEENQDESR